jgi:hypothetical protein
MKGKVDLQHLIEIYPRLFPDMKESLGIRYDYKMNLLIEACNALEESLESATEKLKEHNGDIDKVIEALDQSLYG